MRLLSLTKSGTKARTRIGQRLRRLPSGSDHHQVRLAFRVTSICKQQGVPEVQVMDALRSPHV